MPEKTRGVLSLVAIPALLSLVVSVVRLFGEINGWNPTLFGNAGPGETTAQGLLGISWLIPIFGFWFGLRLRGLRGEPKHAGKAALLFLLGIGVFIGGMAGLSAAGLIVMPNADAPAEAKGFGVMLALIGAAAIVALCAWPRLAFTLAVYAVLARIPVIVITWLALDRAWDTHYTKLPTGLLIPEGVSKFEFLAMPQGTFWIALTMLGGGLCGCLGAALRRKS